MCSTVGFDEHPCTLFSFTLNFNHIAIFVYPMSFIDILNAVWNAELYPPSPNLKIWTPSSLQDSNINRPVIICFLFFHLPSFIYLNIIIILPCIYLRILIFATFMKCKLNYPQLYEGYRVPSSLLAINMGLIIPPWLHIGFTYWLVSPSTTRLISHLFGFS